APRVRDAGAEVVRRPGLAQAGDVVQLALDGHQRGLLDRRRRYLLAAMEEAALGQRMLLEHVADGVEVEIRREIHDREIFVVETPMPGGTLAIAFDQVMEELDM